MLISHSVVELSVRDQTSLTIRQSGRARIMKRNERLEDSHEEVRVFVA